MPLTAEKHMRWHIQMIEAIEMYQQKVDIWLNG